MGNTDYRPSRSENAKVLANREAKADRLILERRCQTLALVEGKLWVGTVRGDSATYLVVDGEPSFVAYDRTPGIVSHPEPSSCQCEGFGHVGRCAHVAAARKLRLHSGAVPS